MIRLKEYDDDRLDMDDEDDDYEEGTDYWDNGGE